MKTRSGRTIGRGGLVGLVECTPSQNKAGWHDLPSYMGDLRLVIC